MAVPSIATLLFWLIASLTGLCAIAVVVSQNIVRSAAWLLFTLGGVSAIFFLLGADFVGATQLIVYVGGVLVLVVFGVMLTAQGPFVTMKTGAAEWAIAFIVGSLLFVVIAFSTLSAVWFPPGSSPDDRMQSAESSPSSVEVGMAFLGSQDVTPKGQLTGMPAEAKPVDRKRIGYLLPFEIVSVHLLVVLIGAAYLARAKRRREVAGS